jgi:thioredoxin 1
MSDAAANVPTTARVDSEAAFADALRQRARGLLVVNYTASWCKHCERLRPALDALRERYGGGGDDRGVGFVDADVDGLPFTARRVRWTPTVALYRNGRLVDAVPRARPTQVEDRVWLHAAEDPDERAGWGPVR